MIRLLTALMLIAGLSTPAMAEEKKPEPKPEAAATAPAAAEKDDDDDEAGEHEGARHSDESRCDGPPSSEPEQAPDFHQHVGGHDCDREPCASGPRPLRPRELAGHRVRYGRDSMGWVGGVEAHWLTR